MEEKTIRYVAIYLRKSRGDEETALEKHRLLLTDLCKENKWKYIEYQEIMSGDSIAMRPVFTQLLTDVENGIYDAVCVADIDRLGRGNQADQGKINQAFSSSNTYIVTPQQIYNLNNDDDEFVVDMKSFISRREYKQIVKRLSQGKKIGSRQGNWTNGTPPYPYEYERYNDKYNPKGLVINDEKFKIYRFIIDSVLNDSLTPKQISVELNNKNIPSPKNSCWHGNTIYRLLLDETHLGKIISNKSKGDAHAKKKPSAKEVEYLSKENWVIINNCHEMAKTQEEHEKILVFLSRLIKAPRRTQNSIMPLSGLIKCDRCGHTMGVYKRVDRNMKDVLKTCWFVDEYGNKCGNSSINLNVIYEFIKIDSKKYLDKLIKQATEIDINENKLILEQKIILINNELEGKKKSLDRILEAFENGLYSLEQFKERKEKTDIFIQKLQQELEIINIQIKQIQIENINEKIKKMEYFLEHFDDSDKSDTEKNKLFKTVIDYIKYNRNGDDVKIRIKYL